MTANLKIEESTHAGHAVLDISGEIDLATAPELESTLSSRIGAAKTIVDLSTVSFIDSTGLRVLLTVHEAAEKAGGRLVLISADGPVNKLFAITGVHDLLHIATTRDAAVAHA
ncbi:MAG: STAS domain-containing protein [Acidimicrobiia bacterium]|nr:STAS domain-containing protein [Acidimicrobiia bacterium]